MNRSVSGTTPSPTNGKMLYTSDKINRSVEKKASALNETTGRLNWTGILLLVMLPVLLSAQSRNQEVTIIAPYQPTISEAYKIQMQPTVIDSAVEMPQLDYSIRSDPFSTFYEAESLEPVFIELTPEKLLRRNYLKAGFGNYTMPYVEFFSNNLESDEFSLGFHARHLSSQGEIEDYATSIFSQNDASLYGKRYLKNSVLSAKLFYDRDVVHYYGFKPADYTTVVLTDDDLKQRFSQLGLNAGIASNYSHGSKMNYDLRLNFYRLDDLYETSETYANLNANLNSKNEFFNFVEKQELGINIKGSFFYNQDSLTSKETILAGIKPYISLHFDYFDLFLGVEGAVVNDSATDFFVYPAVRASYQVIPDYLRFYASATGGLYRNSYRKVTEVNPWVNPIFPLGNTNTKYEIRAGVTGRLDLLLDYDFSVSYADVENMMFFVNDFTSPFSPVFKVNLGNKFTAVYDDVKLTTIKLEAGYEQIDKLNIHFRAAYYDYQLSLQSEAWHKPAFDAGIMARYFVDPELSVSTELYFQGKLYARVLEDDVYKINERGSYVDLNLGAEYRFSDRISAFARLNNVTATRYFRWYNYPSQRINVMGGFTFSF